MTQTEPVRRATGAALSLLVPGLGQFVWGRVEAGGLYFALGLVGWLAVFLLAQQMGTLPWWLLPLGFAAHAAAALEALRPPREEPKRKSRLP